MLFRTKVTEREHIRHHSARTFESVSCSLQVELMIKDKAQSFDKTSSVPDCRDCDSLPGRGSVMGVGAELGGVK